VEISSLKGLAEAEEAGRRRIAVVVVGRRQIEVGNRRAERMRIRVVEFVRTNSETAKDLEAFEAVGVERIVSKSV